MSGWIPWRRTAPSGAEPAPVVGWYVQEQLAAARKQVETLRRENAGLRLENGVLQGQVRAAAVMVASAERECAAGCVHERLFKNAQRHAAELERRLSEVTGRSFASDVAPVGFPYRVEPKTRRRELR